MNHTKEFVGRRRQKTQTSHSYEAEQILFISTKQNHCTDFFLPVTKIRNKDRLKKITWWVVSQIILPMKQG